MIFKIRVFGTAVEAHVDDEGTVTAVYSSDDIAELLSLTAEGAIQDGASAEFWRHQRELAAEAKAEMLADARRVGE